MSEPAELIRAPFGGQVARQDFGGSEIQNTGETSSAAVVAQARAAIESAYIMAMRFPRNLDQVRERLLHSCKRPMFADAAIYSKPVGKEKNKVTGAWEEKVIEDLSIRFAEEAARNMRNLEMDSFVLFDDPGRKIVKFVVTDLECNVKWPRTVTINKTTERRELKKNQTALSTRTNSYGDIVYIVEATPDEVDKMEGSARSKAHRDGVLKLLPADIKDECREMCFATLENKMAADPDGEKKKIVDGYATIGIQPVHLQEYLGHDLGTVSPAELVGLRKLFVAIRDGEITWADALESRTEEKPDAKPEAKPESKPAAKANKIDEATAAARAKREAATKPPAKPDPAESISKPKGQTITETLADLHTAVASRLSDLNMGNHEVTEQYEVAAISDLTKEQCEQVLAKLKG